MIIIFYSPSSLYWTSVWSVIESAPVMALVLHKTQTNNMMIKKLQIRNDKFIKRSSLW